MADTLTTHYSWVMPQDQGSNTTWGAKINADLAAIDSQVWNNSHNNPDVGVVASGGLPATFSFYNTSGQLRWQLVDDNTPEGAGNTGSNLQLKSYDNNGAPLGTPISVTRSNGAIAFSGAVTFTGSATFQGAQAYNSSITCNNFLQITSAGPGQGDGTVTNTQATLLLGGFGGLNNAGFPYLQSTANPFISTGWYLSPGGTGITMAGNVGPIPGIAMNASLTINSAPYADSAYSNAAINLIGNGGISFGDPNGAPATIVGLPSNSITLMLPVHNLGTSSLKLDNQLNLLFNSTGQALKIGGGPWAALTSDARAKTVEDEYRSGLEAVCQLRPVVYTYKGNDGPPDAPSPHQQVAESGERFVGLIAQEVETIFPDMVKQREGYIDGQKVDDLRSLDTTELLFALINSVKELKAEIEALKAER